MNKKLLFAVPFLALSLVANADEESESTFKKMCTEQSISEEKCQCMLDVYEETDVDITKLSDTVTAIAEMQKLSGEATKKLSQCAL